MTPTEFHLLPSSPKPGVGDLFEAEDVDLTLPSQWITRRVPNDHIADVPIITGKRSLDCRRDHRFTPLSAEGLVLLSHLGNTRSVMAPGEASNTARLEQEAERCQEPLAQFDIPGALHPAGEG
jgi:hypothetical protein